MLSLFGLQKIPLKSAGFLTGGFSAEVKVISHQISEGFCCLDWALCCSCLYVELQLLGCNVCCQVFPVFLALHLPQWVTSVFLLQQGPDIVCQIFLKGPAVLDWALCRSCLCVELQSPGCTVCCQVPPNVLPSTFKSVSRSYFCVLDRPNFSIILSAGWYLCFSRALISSAKSFWRVLLFGLSSVSFLPLCWASVAGLHCLLPSTS